MILTFLTFTTLAKQHKLRQPLDLSVPMSQGTGSGVQFLLGEGIPGCGGQASCHTSRAPMLSHGDEAGSLLPRTADIGWGGKGSEHMKCCSVQTFEGSSDVDLRDQPVRATSN